MIAQCPICRSPSEVDDAKITGDGLKMTCPLCDEVFLVKPPSAQSSAPSPSGTRSAATPSHGHSTSGNAVPGSTSASRRLLEEDSGDGAAPRVLVAHDSHVFGATVKTLLEEEGFDVEVVHDGDAAMEVLLSRPPAVAILEAALPKRFGFQICADVRARPEPIPVKLLLVASIYDRKRMARSPALAHAPDEYLEPRNLELELVPKLKRLLRGRESTGSRPAAPAGTRSVDVSRATAEVPRAPEVLPPQPAARRKDPTHPTHPTMGEADFAELFEDSATGTGAKSPPETARSVPPIDDIEAFLAADGGDGKSASMREPDPITVTPARAKVVAPPRPPLRIGDEPSLDSEEREIWDKIEDDDDDQKPKDDDELLRTLMEMANDSSDADGDDPPTNSDEGLAISDDARAASKSELDDDDLGLEFGDDEPAPRASAPPATSELDDILDQVSTSKPLPAGHVDAPLRMDDFLSEDLPEEPAPRGRVPSAGPLDMPSRGPVPASWKPDADDKRRAEVTDEEAALSAILDEGSARDEDDDVPDSLLDDDDAAGSDVLRASELDIATELDDDARRPRSESSRPTAGMTDSESPARGARVAANAPTELGVMPGMPIDVPTVLRKITRASPADEPLDRITEDFDEDDDSRNGLPPVVMEGDDAPAPMSELDDEKSLAEARIPTEDADPDIDDLLESSFGGSSELDELAETKAIPSTTAVTGRKGEEPKNREEHDKAKRLAKLIVGDILLYNADKIPDAVKTGAFFEVMKGDIKDGREFYDDKVSEEVRAERDYIQELLDETLAKKKKELGLT